MRAQVTVEFGYFSDSETESTAEPHPAVTVETTVVNGVGTVRVQAPRQQQECCLVLLLAPPSFLCTLA